MVGQALVKVTATDYDYAWADQTGSGTGGGGGPHGHPESEITNLVADLAALDARLDTLEAEPDPVLDHGGLTGLDDDDHPQYLTPARGDARYPALAHSHAITDVTGLQAALDGKAASGAPAAAVGAHEGAADPHPGYLTHAEGNSAYAAAGHAHAGTYDPAGTAAAAVAAHEALTDPHPDYLTPAEADAAYDVLGAASAARTAHEGAVDPHPGYLTQAEGDGRYALTHSHDYDATGTAAAAVAAHEALSNPHPIYLTEAEADALYAGAGHDHNYAASGHTHPAPDLSGYALLTDPRFVLGGGLTGQVLAKATDADHDLTWMTPASVSHDHSGVYDLAGAATNARTAHEAASDPHPGYLTATEGNAAYAALSHNHNASAINAGTLAYARLPVGTTANTVAAGDDPRMTNARTPVAHVHSGADITTGTVPFARLPVGATSTSVAVGNHTHEGLGGGGGGFSAGIVPATSTTPTITHGLGTRDLIVSVREVATDLIVRVATETIGDNDLRFTFTTQPTVGQYRYTILSAAATLGTGAHSHAISEVTGLGDSLDGKAASDHTHVIADTTALQTALDDKATSGHTHTDYAATGHDHGATYSAIDHVHTPASIGAADSSHTHDYSAVYSALGHSHSYAAVSHTHAAADVASGTLAFARIPTGTTSTTVAIGNHTHGAAAPAAHASSHATGQSDAISPASIGAAATSHTHAQYLSGLVPYPPVDISYASTIATDASAGNHFRVGTFSGNPTLGTPSTPTDGQRAIWECPAGGSARTLGLSAAFEKLSGVDATLAIPANKIGFLTAIYNSSRAIWTVMGWDTT